MSASYRNEAPLVDLLLTMGADINARDREGRTALVWASWKGLEPVVLLLLHRGKRSF
jgi:ankyrin repeat protein